MLEMAVGRGMLSVDEFTAASDLVLSAGTVRELRTTLARFPEISGKVFDDQPSVLRMDGRKLVRSGQWQAPGAIRLLGRNGRVLLDFSQAEFHSMTLALDVELTSVRLKIIAPRDAAVDLTQLHTTHCRTVNRSLPEADTFISIVLSGRAVYGSVVAKSAK